MRNEMMKRLKGWLALVLCFGMMFGSSLTVLAAENYSFDEIEVGDTISKDDMIKQTLSGGTITVTYSYGNTDVQKTRSLSDGYKIESEGGCEDWKVIAKTPEKVVSTDLKYYLELEAITEPDKPSSGTEQEPEQDDGKVVGSVEKHEQNDGKVQSGGDPHEHNFEWFMTKDPTRTEDGESSYICHSCGYVAAKQPVTRWQFFMKQYRELFKNAEQNATVTFEADDMPCISDYMLGLTADRPDVTVVIHFTVDGVNYELTIPAGTDFSAVQNDTVGFYGYLGLAAKLGLTANVIS